MHMEPGMTPEPATMPGMKPATMPAMTPP
jgi:hypothetical protein